MRLVRLLAAVVLTAAVLLSAVDGFTQIAGADSAALTYVMVPGTGTAYFSLSATTGGFIDIAWMPESSVTEGPIPPGRYPFGFFSFVIGGLSPGETAIVLVALPTSNLPEDTVWVKVQSGTYRVISAEVSRMQLWLTLTADGSGNIIDPGAPGQLSAGPVGGRVQPVNTFALVAPWLALVAVVGCIGTVVVVAKKRRP